MTVPNKTFESILYANDPILHGGLRTKNVLKKKESNKPLISIITVVLNGEKYLEECILSLHAQQFDNYEHIIIDGGSKDNTLQIINKYEDKIDYWCQKKDKGLYDAFNLGMKLSRGDYIGFLNSDDIFTPNALSHLNKYIHSYREKDFIFGAVKKHWGVLHGYKPYKIYWSWGFYSSHSTGFFIKLASAKKVGLYNLNYKCSSDYDYFFRMIVQHKMDGIGTTKDEVFGVFRRGGHSSTFTFMDNLLEDLQIRINNKQNKLVVLCIFIYKFLKSHNKI